MYQIKKVLAVALSIVTALTLSACGGSNATSAVSAEQKEQIVLTVNDRQFTAEEYAAAFLYNQNRLDNMMASVNQKTSKDITDAADRQSYSDNVAELAKKQLAYIAVCEQQMAAKGLEITQEQIDEQFKLQEDLIGGDIQLNATLKELGLTRDQYADFIRMNLMINALNEAYIADNPDAARQKFDQDYLRCKHVLVKTVDDNNQELEGQDELKAKAEDIAKRAKAGEDFDALIKEYNEDPGMESNPDGYVFAEGEMVTEFYEGTKALAYDQVSDPIKTSYGWHIIKRLPLRDEDFESKKSDIEQALFSEQADSWQAQAKIEPTDLIKQINLDTARNYTAS